jgi:hypothetical protein
MTQARRQAHGQNISDHDIWEHPREDCDIGYTPEGCQCRRQLGIQERTLLYVESSRICLGRGRLKVSVGRCARDDSTSSEYCRHAVHTAQGSRAHRVWSDDDKDGLFWPVNWPKSSSSRSVAGRAGRARLRIRTMATCSQNVGSSTELESTQRHMMEITSGNGT